MGISRQEINGKIALFVWLPCETILPEDEGEGERKKVTERERERKEGR